jgi:predicted esterase
VYRLLAGTFVLLPAGPAAAQADLYELGRRLKTFEAAWETVEDPEARARAAAGLEKITGQFFTGQFGEAGRALDRAAFALRSDAEPAAARQWGWSLSAFPETRLVDGSATELAVTVRPFYPVKGAIPKNLELQLWFTNKQVVTVRPEKFPVTVKVPLPPLGDARGLDRKLYFLADAGKDLRPAAVGVSQAADLANRLGKLKAAAAGGAETIERATARARSALLHAAAGAKDPPAPTDLPFADLLANAETMLDGKPFFTPERHGQFWLSVPLGGGEVIPCRVHVPKGLRREKPAPVVVALHGAGGDENLFFEGYGAGKIVRECAARGWVLVAPRSGLALGGGPRVADVVDKLGERYPIDRQRLLVVGHSMGAGQAIAQAAGGKFAAVAFLGGAGRVPKGDAFAALPTFVGVGEKDGLARAAARALAKSLENAGAKAVTFKEYPGVDHLLIVRAALDDVFALFDKVAGPAR